MNGVRLGVVSVPVPIARGTAKQRILATLKVIAQDVERLPEPACIILEESRILNTLRRHIGTGAAFTQGVIEPLSDAIGSLLRASAAMQGSTPRRRRR